MAKMHPSSEPWQRLRDRVAQEQYCVSGRIYREIRERFVTLVSGPQRFQQMGPEYGMLEFLLCVDDHGEPVPFSQEVLEDFEQTADRYPEFTQWFEAVASDESGLTVLLVARWLCHLIGIRHRTVHLFIDHPQMDYTLVQVRGLGKAESPGCFDLPAAGHIAGLQLTTDTLFRELEEELGLDSREIVNLEQIGCYEYKGVQDGSGIHNVEFRTIFCSSLKAGRLDRMRFADGEVAAICLFATRELETLLRAFPERVASGLRESFPLYLRSKGEQPQRTFLPDNTSASTN